jgi:hypothetical protein
LTGVHGLVGRQRHDLLHAAVDGCVEQVHRPDDVGLHGLVRVVFHQVHVLQGRRVDHVVDAREGAVQAGPVADVADEEAEPGSMRRELLLHVVLFELIAAVDDDAPHIGLQEALDEGVAQ